MNVFVTCTQAGGCWFMPVDKSEILLRVDTLVFFNNMPQGKMTKRKALSSINVDTSSILGHWYEHNVNPTYFPLLVTIVLIIIMLIPSQINPNTKTTVVEPLNSNKAEEHSLQLLFHDKKNPVRYCSSTPESSHILPSQFHSGIVHTKLSTRVGIAGHFDKDTCFFNYGS